MNLTEIRAVLKERGLAPNTRFGQNFLHDENLARWIVSASGAKEGCRVLEIGPGLGALTEYFLECGAEVTVLEIDRGMADFLEERFAEKKIVVVRGDAMKTLRDFLDGNDILAGNLPYNAAVPLMMESALGRVSASRMVWMVQKEIAERVRARPSTPAYGAVSVVMQIFCRVVEVRSVGRKVFYPEPEVDSAILVLEPSAKTQFLRHSLDVKRDFSEFVRAGFVNRRKMLRQFLRGQENWNDVFFSMLGMRGDERPEEVSPECWVQLFEKLGAVGDGFKLDK